MKSARKASLWFLLLLLLIPTASRAAQGDLDTSFNGTGYHITNLTESTGAYAMALQPDGKIVTVGYWESDILLTRYTTGGTLDAAFGFGTGRATYPFAEGYGVAIHNNKIVVVGRLSDRFFVARFDDTGVLDTSFNPPNGYVVWDNGHDSAAYGVVVYNDNSVDKILVVGYSYNGNYDSDFLLVRYTWDGILDTSFGAGGAVIIDAIDCPTGACGGSWYRNDSVIGKAVAVQPEDGSIVAVVNWSHNSDPYAFSLVRVDSAGEIDSFFGYNGMTLPYRGDVTAPGQGYNGTGDALTILKDGKILVAGMGENDVLGERLVVLRYLQNGYIDTTFGSNGEASFAGEGYWNFDDWGDSMGGMVLQDDGKIILAGTETVDISNPDGSQEDIVVLRFTAGGALDGTFGNAGVFHFNGPLNGNDEGRAVALQPDGKIVVAGEAFKGLDSGSRDQVVFRVIGAPPVMHMAPLTNNTFDFGNVVFSSSKTQTFTVSNTGGMNLVLGQLAVAGADQAKFVRQNDLCSNTAVAPGSDCTVDIVFTPGTVSATPYAATLSIPSNDPVLTTYAVTLLGTGTTVPPPAVSVSPDPVSFGSVNSGATTFLIIAIWNTGGSPLNVTSIGVTGDDATMFEVAPGGGYPCSMTPTIEADAGCTLAVSFTPATFGSKKTTLRIVSNAPTKDVMMTGTWVGPMIEVSPLSVNFTQPVTVGAKASMRVDISNYTGGANLVVTGIEVAGGQANEFGWEAGVGDPCPNLPATIPPLSSCSVSLTFSPTLTGAKSTTLRIYSNDPFKGLVEIDVNGSAVAPDVTVSPIPVTFDPVAVGTLGTKEVTISNTGGSVLMVAAAGVFGGNAAMFGVTTGGSNPCPTLNPSLQPGSSCTFVVTFNPTSIGGKSTTLEIYSNDTFHSPKEIEVTGTGVAPMIEVSPDPVPFDPTVVGTTVTKTVTISNAGGTSPLHVSSIGLTDGDIGMFGVAPAAGSGACAALPPTILAGESCTVTVSFTPASTGLKSTTLHVVSDALNMPTKDVTVNGTGVIPPTIVVTPSPVAVDPATVGGVSTTREVTISNTGTLTLTVTSIVVTGGDSGMFGVAPGGGIYSCGSLSGNIRGGGSCTVVVSFTPGSPGLKTTTLQIVSNASNGATKDVTVTGIGVPALAPHIDVTPSPVAFGDVNVEEEAHKQVTISNATGTAPLVVGNIVVTGGDSGLFGVATGGVNPCEDLSPTIPEGRSCTVIVKFAPTFAEAGSTTLRVVSNDPIHDTLDIPVTGTGLMMPVTPKGTVGTAIVINGSGFGTAKPKVTVGGVAIKVASWTDGEIRGQISKPLPPGTYAVLVYPKKKSRIAIAQPFEFSRPGIETLTPKTGRINDIVTIQGSYFGTKKGKVYLGGKSCKIKTWTMLPTSGWGEIQFFVPKGVPTGVLDLKVTVKGVGDNNPVSFQVLP